MLEGRCRTCRTVSEADMPLGLWIGWFHPPADRCAIEPKRILFQGAILHFSIRILRNFQMTASLMS
jgi:hypothetical protein